MVAGSNLGTKNDDEDSMVFTLHCDKCGKLWVSSRGSVAFNYFEDARDAFEDDPGDWYLDEDYIDAGDDDLPIYGHYCPECTTNK